MAEFFVFVIVGVILSLLGVIIIARSKGKKMDKKAQELGAISAIYAQHIEGIGLANKTECELYLFSDKIQIDSNGRKFEIPLSRVRAVEYKSEQELHEKSKSVVGRAIIGTLLVPGLGTIVGGMSGIGTKKTTGQMNFYLIINFTDANGQLSGVTFLNNLNFVRLRSFCSKIDAQLSTMQPEVITL